ncbi:MAG: hypothetical protein IJE28_02610, partial [Oscillospiraceae bacterium]|nr:hypothetical protein [Oscillospiraceae bacterium]
PPLGKGGFCQKAGGYYPPYIFHFQLSTFNLKRISPVLSKQKPPPFNKGGFQQKRSDNIRPE